MKFKNVTKGSAEKVSQRVFYCLIGLAVVVFALFFLVGYDIPFEENPDFNAPLFTDVLIFLMLVLLIFALVLAICSIVSGYRKSEGKDKVVNGVPVKKIFRWTWVGTFFLLVITFLLGSSTPILVNGSEYTNWSWLKISDMFVFSSLVMLLCAIIAVLFGASRYVRKGKS